MAQRPAHDSPPSLENGELDFVVDNDPAYVAIVDPASYEKDLPDWDYDTLTRMITEQMNAGRIVAWGTPEDSLRIRMTTTPLTAEARARVKASFVARLKTAGTLCLANYTSLTMCAQFDDDDLPQPEDAVFRVPAGEYSVEVNRTFRHEAGEQFAQRDPPPNEPHYVVVLRPADAVARTLEWVPWALAPAR